MIFSDYESRGFGLAGSRIPPPDRLARLLFVTALALHWAVSAGMWEAAHQPLPGRKAPGQRPKRVARSRTSFKRGLRPIQGLLQLLIPLPPFWGVWRK
jgi:hypothetical protein